MTDLSQLTELKQLAIKEAQKYPQKRFLFQRLFAKKGKYFIALVGPRGVGKTILLKQFTKESVNAFYISLDTAPETDLFEIAKVLSEKPGIKKLFLDEIYNIQNYEREIKKIYDFLDIQVIFSSSVALSLSESSYDLSRGLELITLNPFSFREYIYFKTNFLVPKLSLGHITNKKWSMDYFRYIYLFDDYLKGGLSPFSLR